MKKTGIYCIENLKNGKKYIGQAVNLKQREKKHFSSLKGNYHSNTHLQNSYNKYGKNNFKFRVLLYCESFELTRYEQFFVDLYAPELLYNVRLECVDSNQGITLSKEARKKISESHNGKHHSKETKEKISEANSGKNNSNYGKHPSKETRKKMSEAKRGENCYSSKLTENQVFEILDLYYNKSKTQMDISKMFPVNDKTISKIVRGKLWKSCYKKFMENNKK